VTFTLRNSFAVSAAAHLLALSLLSWGMNMFSPRLPRITEITLVSGESKEPATMGAGQAAAPGGHAGQSVRTVKAASKGHVTMASPEFVPIGRKPRRSGETLMGSETGAGGGVIGANTGPGSAAGLGRRIKYQEPLEYPDWAKEQGIDAKVTLQFKVLSSGAVDTQIIVKRTAGWRQLDELAIKSLRNFQFEPLDPASPQVPQWGELTFHFKPE
jgi:TonB family protein